MLHRAAGLAAMLALALAETGSMAHAMEKPLERAPDGRRLVLTFSDDFAQFRPYGGADGIWRTTYGDGTWLGLDGRTLPANAEMEVYVDPAFTDAHGPIGIDPFRLKDGCLDILAMPTPHHLLTRLDDHPYVSGMISSQPSFAQAYGYFEMRAKIPSGAGMWPAFWLLRKDLKWPPEIDVMESVGDASKVYSTVHSKLMPSAEIEGRVAPDAFHTYAVAWDPKRVEFYVDGHDIGGQATPADLDQPMYMIANLAVGGTWPGPPDSMSEFPAVMSIDYIRAYRFAK
jgi:hypothetical protein